MGSVNCCLIQAGGGYILVDTGAPNARARLRRKLENLGCLPGRLALILVTHGDFDHMGNAAHVRRAYGSRIGMHPDDVRMAETGDMFANRSRSNTLLRMLAPKLIGFGREERFTPDVLLADASPLAEYGLDARVISLPGHSKGSIGILTADGDFLCGDLLENTQQPRLNSIVDDQQASLASLARVRGLEITRIYPGHGEPFTIDQLTPE
jgi:glyoxylase-like metal-dependent hydrolase (beta-lactamase superfamily II)